MHLFFLCVLLLSAMSAQSIPPPDAPAAEAAFILGERLAAPASTAQVGYREVTWDDLIPDSWNPEQALADINLDTLSDDDPRAQQALDQLRAMLDSAPAEPSLEGQKIKLAGFIVPLEYKGDNIHEFLLVPYFGACIHTPPPPANQIVHVFASNMPADAEAMTPFWVLGTIKLDHSTSEMGFSSYVMHADKLLPYTAKTQ